MKTLLVIICLLTYTTIRIKCADGLLYIFEFALHMHTPGNEADRLTNRCALYYNYECGDAAAALTGIK